MSEQNYGLVGGYPKVGIRPTIDGRRKGVREALEGQTMKMAQAAAKLITTSLRYPNGDPVECVVAKTTIGGATEAAIVADQFRKEGVGVSLTVTPCWCYGSETMDMDPHTPKAVWGFNGTERPGAVYLAAVLAAHNQKGLPAFGIYGHDVQDANDESIPDDVAKKILQFTRAGLAAAYIRGKSYLSIGSVSMGIAGSIIDQPFFEDYLGVRCESVDMSEIIRRIDEGIYDPDEFERALAWVKENCKEGTDNNHPDKQQSREKKDANWEFVVKMTMIGRDLMVGNKRLAELDWGEEALGHNAIAAGFQGQRQWTDHFPNGDFMEAILTSSFDWNGIRAPFVMATENDTLNATSMLFNYLLTNVPSVFADVRTYWSPEAVKRVTGYQLSDQAANGFIHLINSGAASLDGSGQMSDKDGNPTMKPFWEITNEDAQKCLDATSWRPGNQEYFRGGGYSSNFLTRGGMPMTMVRLNIVKGLGPVLQLAEGWSIDLPMNVHEQLDDRTDPTWPTTWFAPRTTDRHPFNDVYSVMNNWGANHAAVAYGHVGADLISLCSILRIPVNMHNVDPANIFRPSMWAAFGTHDLESADYRACQLLGPLYQ
ncbi:MAG: L-fucose isomerase [Anaerolineaceae bacterium]|nr:L-fucose isomerase [Anaerolineaceae bacterium]